MHREISHTDPNSQQDSPLSLYLLTGLLGLLLAADLWPILARWLAPWGLALPSWPNEIGGYRLALVAAVIGGARILYGSLDSLLAGRVGADLALAIACVAAILLREPLVAAEVVFIGMLGECLESITFARTRRALSGLLTLRPRRCWRLRDGQEERVLTSELQVGDRVVVKPGGRLPADGVVLDGRSALDVSALTGESLPQDKGPGDEVLAGSLNQFGALTIEARRVGEHTLAGQVIELTVRALKDKAPLERTADRLARYFLPAVLILATVTFLGGMVIYGTGWFRPADGVRLGFWEAARLSLYPALSVLVVACPCALILATPAAVIAALGRLAGTGILIRGGAALERLATITAFAFDKTGTLTEGRLQLGEIIPIANVSADQLLQIAASAEQFSEHPLAGLIVDEARRRALPLEPFTDFKAHPGSGVTGQTAAGSVLVGNRRLLQEQNISLSAEIEAVLERLDAAGQTALLVVRDGSVLGSISASDRVRPEAPGVLGELCRLGIGRLAMLTGDRAAVARTVAAQLETEEMACRLEVHAELLPQEKAALVAGWQQQERVAMVGDGINDAPALALAQVGLAIAGSGGSGGDLAAETGDIVFMGDPLRSLPLLVRLARETVRIIRQNILIFAFGVNAVGIVLTAWLWPVLLPAAWYEQGPVAAVIYHQLGSLLVLLNSMRLLWFEKPSTSAAYKGLRERLGRVNNFLERWLNVDEWLHWLSHHWRAALAVVVVLLLAGYAVSGIAVVSADEVGIVQRFGRPLPEDLTPGLHFCWPWPVETVRVVKPARIQVVEIGFRTVEGSKALPAARAWSSSHGNDGIRRVPDEAVMITGDGNLIEVQGSVRFRIADPRVWLFEVREPQEVLRSAAESVLRETVAGRTFADLLTSGRERFQQEALARLEGRCREYGKHGLGIRLDGLLLHDLHPPQEVVGSYHAVTQAMEQRDRRVNVAQANALSQERQQQARSLETVRQAEAERTLTTQMAKARMEAFLARYRARSTLAPEQEWSLLQPALEGWLAGQAPEAVGRQYLQRRGEAIARQEALTDFRLYWEQLSAALTGRDKVIIDADQVPGRRHLWMLPFEPPNMPLPAPRPGERSKLALPDREP